MTGGRGSSDSSKALGPSRALLEAMPITVVSVPLNDNPDSEQGQEHYDKPHGSAPP